MSNKEKLLQLAETLNESELAPIVGFATNYLKMLDDAFDDAYCSKLWVEAEKDPDQTTVPLDEFVRKLGFDAKDLRD